MQKNVKTEANILKTKTWKMKWITRRSEKKYGWDKKIYEEIKSEYREKISAKKFMREIACMYLD